MIFVIILIALAFVGVFGMQAMAEAQDFDRGAQPGDILERYARRSALPLLLAVGLIAIVARYAPQIARPPTDTGTVLALLVIPLGPIALSFILRVAPAMRARLARDAEHAERLTRSGRSEESQ